MPHRPQRPRPRGIAIARRSSGDGGDGGDRGDRIPLVHVLAGLLGLGLLLGGALLSGCAPSSGHRASPGGGGGGGGSCPAFCTRCDAHGACLDCPAGQTLCSGGAVFSCNADGTLGTQLKQCAAGEVCAGSDCLSACDAAASTRSYIGCDYWPVTTLSSQINPYFDFAVVVANPASVGDVTQGAPAHVNVFRGAGHTPIRSVTVAPGAVQTMMLPWVPELAQNQAAATGGADERSVLSMGGAYHLVSDLPVTVYQFSPLQFEKPATASCMDGPYKQCRSDADCDRGGRCVGGGFLGLGTCQDTRNCHSYTNDASILLPTAILKTEYLVIARQTFTVDSGGGPGAIPGFFAVVGTEDGTRVTVTYSAYTEAGSGVGAESPGGSASYQLNRGDVLQVASKKALSPCALMSSDGASSYCDLGPTYDLTGTRVVSDRPVAVFGGHSCSFVPYDRWACDHLEEQMVPLDNWGQKVIVAQTQPQIAGEPNVFRVVSGSDGNSITFDPPVHAPVTLGKGQYLELVAQGAFQASGSGRVAVAQYMVGQNYLGAGNAMTATVGDPAFGLGVNVEQMRNSYDFLTPDTYTRSYVNLVAPAGTTARLDGATAAGAWSAIGGTGYAFLRVPLSAGAHHATSDSRFAITVNGVAPYTAYLYVGGQDFNDIQLQ